MASKNTNESENYDASCTRPLPLFCVREGAAGGIITSVPWSVLRSEDDRIPVHDVVWIGGAIYPLGRVLLQAFEVSHEPLQTTLSFKHLPAICP